MKGKMWMELTFWISGLNLLHYQSFFLFLGLRFWESNRSWFNRLSVPWLGLSFVFIPKPLDRWVMNLRPVLSFSWNLLLSGLLFLSFSFLTSRKSRRKKDSREDTVWFHLQIPFIIGGIWNLKQEPEALSLRFHWIQLMHGRAFPWEPFFSFQSSAGCIIHWIRNLLSYHRWRVSWKRIHHSDLNRGSADTLFICGINHQWLADTFLC